MRAFFEGPAGSGKTHRLIERTVSFSPGVLTDPRHRLLALTFMNGSRLRLNGRLSAVHGLRGRFQCTTFDSFAGLVVQRQRSLLRTLPTLPTEEMNQFDVICRDATRLLHLAQVRNWVATSHPLVIVDEAQDLDQHRFGMLSALAGCTHVIAAADSFQNLRSATDTPELMSWLRACDEATQLTQIYRTSQAGLLQVAAALRNGTAATAGLTAFKGKQVGYWGAGIRILAVPAKTAGLLAWTVASELSGMSSRAAVLTPDAHTPKVLEVIARVQSPPPFNRTSGTFGPFAIRWERADEEEAREIWSSIPGADALSIPEAIAAVKSLGCAERRSICDRIEAARILRGESHVSRERLREIVEDVVRNGRRFAPAEPTGRRVMTIHRAKNREFANVVVLWPQTVGGGAEQQRRLLYNAITRAKNGCSVVVFGVDRLGKPPFSD